VNDSLQGQLFTITLDDNQLTNTSDNTFTWTTDNIPALTTSDIITLTGAPYGSASVTYAGIDSIDIGSFTKWSNDEFEGRFPEWNRVQDMCKDYPGLEIAYRKFKEVYKMVKEDYDGKERARRGHK